ncbi:Rho-binding antiterminator [Vibrio sp. SCSIO 43136]|uniref:Rho-binding antiterminator n=1 Tax=Vibrio sp. SCSIO 43136 TaxID=2819101 RepID=UPI002074E047|nr:Rho-binding antiterminator [Vibrio sp. SCSIO 43136]USD64068.1 Rho-binding antiterminator [Vibrio sp. SCSIO 43136]
MISCEKYDYVEIACMHRYPVKLSLKSGGVVMGTALDTARNDDKQECILLQTDEQQTLVVLDKISVLEVCVDNPHFVRVNLS